MSLLLRLYLFGGWSLIPNFRHEFLAALRTLALITPKAHKHHKKEMKSVISFKALQILWFTFLIPTDALENPTLNICQHARAAGGKRCANSKH